MEILRHDALTRWEEEARDPTRAGCRSPGGASFVTVRLAVLLLPVVAAAVTAQELTPRFYAPAPTGANIMVLSYGRSTGELLFDPALPFDDVNAAINNSTLLYGRTFGLLGRSANVAVAACPMSRRQGQERPHRCSQDRKSASGRHVSSGIRLPTRDLLRRRLKLTPGSSLCWENASTCKRRVVCVHRDRRQHRLTPGCHPDTRLVAGAPLPVSRPKSRCGTG